MAGESYVQQLSFNYIGNATVALEAVGNAAKTALCVSQGFAPAADVSTWGGAGCAKMGLNDTYSRGA